MAEMRSQLITFENQSKGIVVDRSVQPRVVGELPGTVPPRTVGLGDERSGAAHLVSLPQGTAPPAGAWNLILMDRSDPQGALGYHRDENGTGIPYAEVFVADAVEDGSTAAAVASHEALEMLVDPNVDPVRTHERPGAQQVYIVEACDAVQGNDYDVGAPEGKTTGINVAVFCLPSWWTMDPSSAPYSFRQNVTSPWDLAPEGCVSVAPTANPSAWTQIYGSQMDRLPKWASRLPRIHST